MDSSLVHKILIGIAVVVALVLAPYILGPILIWKTLRQSAKPRIGTFPADDPKLPKKVAAYFRTVTEALEPLGFEVAEGLTLPEQTPNVKAIVLMYANRRDKVAAIASAMFAKEDGKTKLKTTYVEFATKYRDGNSLLTNNVDQISAFAPRDDVTITRLPKVTEADRLYQIHKAMEKREGNRSGKVFRLDEEFKGDAAAYLAAAMVEELDSQLEPGYLYLTSDEEEYRPTWKGAFLMTWGQLPPFKNLAESRRDREARYLLAELEK